MSHRQHTQERDRQALRKRTKAPGDVGAGARHFATETELTEATECPANATGRESATDGTTCAGPCCPHWNLIITRRDAHTNEPLRGEALCTLGNRTAAMGVINKQAKN